MDLLEQLGVALGLASLAGVNLYLTTFVVGLSVRFGWLDLFTQYEKFEILGSPAVLGVAGSLFLIEFFADKIPWVDSAWDGLHTFIRPVGGTMLALGALGTLDPEYTVIAGLLSGGASLVTHAAKASTRAMINLSPEPVSNVIASSAEDGFVLGGLGLIAFAPVVSFFAFAGFVIICAYLIWKFGGKIKSVIARFRRKKHPDPV